MYDVSVLAVGALAMVDDHSGGDNTGGDNSLEGPGGGGHGDREGSVEDAGIGGSVEDKDNESN